MNHQPTQKTTNNGCTIWSVNRPRKNIVQPATQNAPAETIPGLSGRREKCQTINCSCSLLNSCDSSVPPSLPWQLRLSLLSSGQTTTRRHHPGGIMIIIFRSLPWQGVIQQVSHPTLEETSFRASSSLLLVAIDKWRRLCFACHPLNFHCSGCLSAEIPSPSLTGGVNSICYRTKNVKSPRNGLGLEEEGSSGIVSSATQNSSRNILHNILNGEESWADLISPGWQCSHGGQKTFCSHNEFWRWFPVVYVFAWTDIIRVCFDWNW